MCERWIREAVERIPAHIRDRIENVAFILEDRPRLPRPGELGYHGHGVLLGLYRGIPLPTRNAGYSMVPPDTITLFQAAIETVAGGEPDDVKRVLQDTVWHEIAHYLGMNESEVRAWEQKRGRRT